MKQCGTCYYFQWRKNFNGKAKGNCLFVVAYPSSMYAVGGGYKREVYENDGRSCPCWVLTDDKTRDTEATELTKEQT
jgi:hypothetical protein